jgi:hypothetical protein
MRAVDKGLTYTAYVAGGIGLAQNKSIEANINTIKRNSSIGVINQARFEEAKAQRAEQIAEHMHAGQERQNEILMQGFQELIDQGEDVIYEQQQANELQRYQTEVLEHGFGNLAVKVDTLNEEAREQTQAVREQTQAVYFIGELICKHLDQLNKDLSAKLELSNIILSDLNWGQKNSHLVDSMETEKEGERFLTQYRIDSKRETQEEAFQSFQKALTQDRFNVSAGFYLNNLEVEMNKDKWIDSYHDLFSKVKAEMESVDENRRSIAENIAKKMAVSHAVHLFSAGAYKEFLSFYSFAHKHSSKEWHIFLDVFKTVSLFASRKKPTQGEKWYERSVNKWGLDNFSRELRKQNITWLYMDPIGKYVMLHKEYLKSRFRLSSLKTKHLTLLNDFLNYLK